VERILRQHERFAEWHRYLTYGVSPAGMLGCALTCGMFVRAYRTEPWPHAAVQAKVTEADLVIVPEVLVAHALRVSIPHPDKPGTFTNTSINVDVPGIVERMLERTRYAQNVSVGTFADVVTEPCASCTGPTVVAAVDEYEDDSNGCRFLIGKLCEACATVDEVASFYETTSIDEQYGFTHGIYRK
jgi:hypothetical protein